MAVGFTAALVTGLASNALTSADGLPCLVLVRKVAVGSGEQRRHYEKTKMNERSSRSHTISKPMRQQQQNRLSSDKLACTDPSEADGMREPSDRDRYRWRQSLIDWPTGVQGCSHPPIGLSRPLSYHCVAQLYVVGLLPEL